MAWKGCRVVHRIIKGWVPFVHRIIKGTHHMILCTRGTHHRIKGWVPLCAQNHLPVVLLADIGVLQILACSIARINGR
jgi:hypothetical protein